MNVPRQLALALPHAESFARDDFLVGASNDAALATIERWPDWADRVLALVGPEGAGKSHLAAIWAEQRGRAPRLRARARRDRSARLRSRPARWWSRMRPRTLDERALFHLLNLVREEDGYLLLTARTAPATWGVALPDLASRLRAIPVVTVSAPDDALLRAVMVKLFADRQLAVDENLIAYLATRIERSFAAAREAVDAARPRSVAAEARRHARAGGGAARRKLNQTIAASVSAASMP